MAIGGGGDKESAQVCWILSGSKHTVVNIYIHTQHLHAYVGTRYACMCVYIYVCCVCVCVLYIYIHIFM
jgi:hypothetical protein